MANKVTNILIKKKNCKRCGYCIEFCPGKVYGAARDGLPLVNQLENCKSCGLCELRCPDFAIELEVLTGE